MTKRLISAAAVVVAAGAIAVSPAAIATAAPVPSPPLISAAGAPSYEQWISDVTPVAAQAKSYVEERAGQVTKPAIVFDIDNTTLETQYHFDLFRTPAVAPSLAVAKAAAQRGVAVFFVTGRPEPARDVTRNNLIAVGYQVDGLDLTQLTDLGNLQKYKTAKRAAIEAKGYKIIANVGNSASDLAGGYSERTYKLPDYNGALN